MIVMVCHYAVYTYSCSRPINKLAWSLFYRNLELELDKIQTILLCVKYGLVSLPLFDVSHQIDFMLESLCTQ